MTELTYSKSRLRRALSSLAFKFRLDRLGLMLAGARLNGAPTWRMDGVTRVIDPENPDDLYLAIRFVTLAPKTPPDDFDVN